MEHKSKSKPKEWKILSVTESKNKIGKLNNIFYVVHQTAENSIQ